MINFVSSFDYSKDLSLYIHIPFCTKKCSYCAFYSCPNQTEEVKQAFVDKLLKEIRCITQMMDKPFYTAFLGGGNPGCLSTDQLEEICKAVCINGKPKEFTTEMNPESLKEDMFFLFEKYFTRLSMGLQSLSEKALKFLGRNTSLEDTLKGLSLSQKLRRQTGCSLSYDLITCLGPWHDALSDVKSLVSSYDFDHLSLYCLSVEKGTELYKNKITIPNQEEQYDILKPIWQFLLSKGFEHYEVSNFAKAGKKCLHNSVYWSYKPYVGLGPGSASTAFKDKTIRFECDKNLKTYIKSSPFESVKSEVLSIDEAFEEYVIMSLRHKDGLDLNRLKNEYSKKLTFIPNGYEKVGNRICPLEDGLMLSDASALEIISKLS